VCRRARRGWWGVWGGWGVWGDGHGTRSPTPLGRIFRFVRRHTAPDHRAGESRRKREPALSAALSSPLTFEPASWARSCVAYQSSCISHWHRPPSSSVAYASQAWTPATPHAPMGAGNRFSAAPCRSGTRSSAVVQPGIVVVVLGATRTPDRMLHNFSLREHVAGRALRCFECAAVARQRDQRGASHWLSPHTDAASPRLGVHTPREPTKGRCRADSSGGSWCSSWPRGTMGIPRRRETEQSLRLYGVFTPSVKRSGDDGARSRARSA
jgi:hypothetical protein